MRLILILVSLLGFQYSNAEVVSGQSIIDQIKSASLIRSVDRIALRKNSGNYKGKTATGRLCKAEYYLDTGVTEVLELVITYDKNQDFEQYSMRFIGNAVYEKAPSPPPAIKMMFENAATVAAKYSSYNFIGNSNLIFFLNELGEVGLSVGSSPDGFAENQCFISL